MPEILSICKLKNVACRGWLARLLQTYDNINHSKFKIAPFVGLIVHEKLANDVQNSKVVGWEMCTSVINPESSQVHSFQIIMQHQILR